VITNLSCPSKYNTENLKTIVLQNINDEIKLTNSPTNQGNLANNVKTNNPSIRSVNHSTTVNEYRENVGCSETDDVVDNIRFHSNVHGVITNDQYDAEDFIKQEIKKAFEIQKKANSLFTKNKFQPAKEEYLKALEILHIDPEFNNFLNNNFLGIKTKCMSDVAICYYKLKEYNKAIDQAEEVFIYYNI